MGKRISNQGQQARQKDPLLPDLRWEAFVAGVAWAELKLVSERHVSLQERTMCRSSVVGLSVEKMLLSNRQQNLLGERMRVGEVRAYQYWLPNQAQSRRRGQRIRRR